MSSKIITTVVVLAVVGSFSYIAVSDAVSIKHNLQKQTAQIQQLNVETVQLDTELNKTSVVKEKTAQEVQQLETETQNAILERQKLEAELGAN
jgi:cell division protein FtsB